MGIKVTWQGCGPPVLFATGLRNLMPSTGYSQLLRILRQDMKVIHYGQGLLDNAILQYISDTYADGDKISYIGHSSLSPSIVQSKLIDRAVLLDPSAIPSGYDIKMQKWTAQHIRPSCDVLVIDAEYTMRTFIPDGFNLMVRGASRHTSFGVGHVDILDDFYANTCHQLGIRGCSFRSDARSIRARYRKDVADRAVCFLTHYKYTA